MKNLNYEEIKSIFNKKIFENSKQDLIVKLAEYPQRYISIFRPTKPYTKLIQNITQSHEIRFGDAFEILIENIFIKNGYKLLEKNIKKDDKKKSIDQLFEKNNQIIFIEQKIRDDHDSSKKVGQISNFEDKIYLLIDKYPNKNIKAYFYFIDPTFKKNKNFYLNEIKNLSKAYNINVYLAYGNELFKYENIDGWCFIIKFLVKWKKELPNFPEINFDKNPKESFEEIKNLPPKYFRKLLTNKRIVKEIFPILFPEKKTLNLLREYFKTKNKSIFEYLYEEIGRLL